MYRVSAVKTKTSFQAFVSLPQMWNVSYHRQQWHWKAEEMAPRSIVLVSHKHTLIPLLPGQTVRTASFTSQPETPTDRPWCVLMWCKHVLECIRRRLKKEENKEEGIFLCWRSFLFRDINATKNNRHPLSRCAFHRGEKQENGPNREEIHRGVSLPHVWQGYLKLGEMDWWSKYKCRQMPGEQSLNISVFNGAKALSHLSQTARAVLLYNLCNLSLSQLTMLGPLF